MNITRPHFVVSDLHSGDKGNRDNFHAMSNGRREDEFNDFLDYVESENGELTIDGDLFELWQSNISKVMTCRLPLLDRLARMGARYLLGNHDIDLKYFINGLQFQHPLFQPPNLGFQRIVEAGGKKVLIIHGHEQDQYCCNEAPDLGRISAIYTGMKEDRNGGPLLKDIWGSTTVEARCLGRWARIGNFFARLGGKPSASQVMRWAVLKTLTSSGCDALIYGHTHEPGQFTKFSQITGNNIMLPVYNSGTWAEKTNTFVRIGIGGAIELLDWVNGQPQPNTTVLEVK